MEKPFFKDFLYLGLAKCMNEAQACSGSIFIYDDKNDELILEVAKNSRGIALEGIKLKIGEGISGSVARNKKPLLVHDVSQSPFLDNSSRRHDYLGRSFLSIPLEHSGDLLGVINLTDHVRGQSFSSTDLDRVLDTSKDFCSIFHSLKFYIQNQRMINQELQMEIEQLKRSLDHATKFSSLGKLAGGFVHELNNPLDGIIRYVNLAYDNLEDDGVVREYLLEAKEGLNRIVKIVRSLLDFSWNLSKGVALIDINRAIDESLFMAQDYIESSGIEVVKRYSPHVPAIPDYRIKLVFINLIKNACAAMSETGGTLTISTAVEKDHIAIVFNDTGCGISGDIIDKIFDPFFTTKKIGEGAGLGLAICYETIQRYHGDITVSSQPHKGATFHIRLPLSQEIDPLATQHI